MLRKGFYLLPSLTRNPTALTKAYTKSLLTTHNTSYFATTSKGSQGSKKDIQGLAKEIEEKGEKLGNLGVIKIVTDKNLSVEEVSKQKEFPEGALLAGILVTAPLLIGSISLNVFTLTGTFASSLPTLFMGLTKYAGLHLAFMSGIHWGFAISEHDCQINAESSQPKIRNYFALTAIPVLLSFLLTGNLVYGFALSSINYKMMNLGAMMALHTGIFLTDSYMYQKRRIPLWYLRLKLGTTLATLVSLSLMGVLMYNAEDKIKIEKDPIRKKALPSEEDILSGNLNNRADVLA